MVAQGATELLRAQMDRPTQAILENEQAILGLPKGNPKNV
jgi:hypothetical protein